MVDGRLSPIAEETSLSCCSAAILLIEPPKPKKHRRPTTLSASSSFLPTTHFTDHESLPRLPDAFAAFAAAYPKYTDTHLADRIRTRHYPHLSSHVSLDYSGLSLFSPRQPHSFRISSGETNTESSLCRRITRFLNISDDDYTMTCTANTTSAFKLLAESYPFHSRTTLLTVYDHHSDAVDAMTEAALKKGAKVSSASFSWPSFKIHSAKLMKTLKGRRGRGLFVFPLQSRMSGVKYPYLWMRLAQQNGWHVALDAGALGPKEMHTLGLSLIQPDFIICSFFKVFGENPSGFAGLFIKKSTCAAVARSIGVVSIVPDDDAQTLEFDQCRGLDHADSLGLLLINSRMRCITNWLVSAMLKLRHPCNEKGRRLVRIYGPRVKFDRAPAMAFNVFDWRGEKVEPALVLRLADRSNISLTCGFLHNIWFSDKYGGVKDGVLEARIAYVTVGNRRRERYDLGISVVNASLGFLSNFEDAYRLWAFVARFLDADFVEKERWRYMALNQKMIEV